MERKTLEDRGGRNFLNLEEARLAHLSYRSSTFFFWCLTPSWLEF
jgi:hypothetical protein